jgi:hypothetical protein
MDNNKRFDQIELLLSEVLRNQDRQTEILQQHTGQLQQVVNTFNIGFEAMLKKMDEFTAEVKGLRQDFAKFADHEDRIRKIEEIIFKKGA